MTPPTPSPRPGPPRPTPASFGSLPGAYAWANQSDETSGTAPLHQPAGSGGEVTTSGEVTTGDAEIDAALADLSALGDRPLRDHIAAGERVHELLQSRLGDLGGS